LGRCADTQYFMTKPIKKIVLIEPKETGWNVFSLVKVPRLGVPILGTILRNRGFKVKIFVEKIAPINWNYIRRADLVGISVVSNTAYESYKMAEKIRSFGIPVVFGGPHATFESDEALQYGDYVLRGEGEETLLALIEALNGKRDFKDVPALSYWQGKTIVNNPGHHFCQNIDITPDFSLVHGFRKFYDRRWHLGVSPMEVLTTRGCPYGCKFCSVIKMAGRKMRKRSVTDVVDEIEYLVTTYKKKSVFFVDDNFTADRPRAKQILRLIIARGIKARFSAQVRVETAQDKELVSLMKAAGFHLVQIGLESVNPETLRAYDKRQDLQAMRTAIKTFGDIGIFVFGMFVIGSDYDTPATIDATVAFARDSGLVAIEMLPLGSLPGTEMTEKMARENRIVTRDWTRYDGSHALLFAKKMPPSELQAGLMRGYRNFYTPQRIWRYLRQGKGYYAVVNFYGFIACRYVKLMTRSYSRFLKIVEQDKYKKTSRGWELIEPVSHNPEETPLDYPSQKFINRLFGPRARSYAGFSWGREFSQARLRPVVLSLPDDLTVKLSRIPDKIYAFLRRSRRPVIIDFSRLNIEDKQFWKKLSDKLQPFGTRVRLQVARGGTDLFNRLGLKKLNRLSLK
jgi:radical SAM superfamily enzyme YgiQ (UPF0313 family)